MRKRLIAMSGWLVLTIALRASGDVQVLLPLEGYYRPGRFMPVRIKVQGGKTQISLRAAGTAPTVVNVNGDFEAVVPWLMIGSSVRDARWMLGDVGHPIESNLHPLNDRQKLVGLAGGESQSASALFEGMAIIAVPFDVSRSLLKPASAWQALDAVVLSETAMAQLENEQIQTLLAAGTTLVVTSRNRPDNRWPWRRSDDAWVLKYEPSGPAPSIDADVYGPTYSWDRGWPVRFRREIIIWASLFCILLLAVSLWRSRWTVWGCVLACIVVGSVFVWRYSRRSSVLQLQTAVAINHGDLTQIDLWSWRTTLRETDVTAPVAGLAYPMLATAGQVEQMNLQMVCGTDGNLQRLQFHLMPGQSLAVLRRLVRSKRSFGSLVPVPATWQQFAQDVYLRPGDQLPGQTSIQDPFTGQSIVTTVIDRQ